MIKYDKSNVVIEYNPRRHSKWWYILRSLRDAWKRGEETMMLSGKLELIRTK